MRRSPAPFSWLRSNGAESDLCLAPLETSYLVAALPMHALGSHTIFSIRFREQRNMADRFYTSQMTAPEQAEFIKRFGVHRVVLGPNSTRAEVLKEAVERAEFGMWKIFEFPQERMKPYPKSS